MRTGRLFCGLKLSSKLDDLPDGVAVSKSYERRQSLEHLNPPTFFSSIVSGLRWIIGALILQESFNFCGCLEAATACLDPRSRCPAFLPSVSPSSRKVRPNERILRI